MNISDKPYVIGIDLGTTNSAISYAELSSTTDQNRKIKLFKIPQLTGPGEITPSSVLPSFLYIPGQYDIAKEAISFPVDKEKMHFVGTYARDHGAKVPSRLVSSAKSWLCNSAVDRKAPILPWGAGQEIHKVSPVYATALYLTHIKQAWNKSKGKNEEHYLENQFIIITVPASFDEVARELTLEAATMAGLSNITLLEEPLAAFYSWLIQHGNDWDKYVKPNELILVCDVGGGTTDFTLITLRLVDGHPRFERIAVGDHLILGGDNVDLALARQIELQLGKQKTGIKGDRWKNLCHQCREAKELILDGKSDSKRIILIGEGSKLIGGTISATLERDNIEEIVLNGFFPLALKKERSPLQARKGITEFGLPYEPEPAITQHLVWFLENHKVDIEKYINKDHAPDLILFNGGSLKPRIIQDQIIKSIRQWFNLDDDALPEILENPDPDLSVALGASYYGLVKMGQGVRVGSGSARAFYLGVGLKEDSENTKINQAICIIERGLEEGSDIELKDQTFEVLANQPVSFDLYSSSYRSGDQCGELINVDDTLTSLPPFQTIIQYGKKGVKTKIPVKIEATFTEMGTLALWCCSQISDHKWQLQFQLRDLKETSDVQDLEVFEESIVKQVFQLIHDRFSNASSTSALEQIGKNIVSITNRPREKWPLSFIRGMADELINVLDHRKKSPAHEARWLNLLGFCLRPGFGDAFDEVRIKNLWKLFTTGPMHPKNAQVRSEWWIFWRRLAGGLNQGQQRQFFQEISTALFPKKNVKTKISPQERLEMWMSLANMERLNGKDRMKCGQELLKELKPKKCKPQHFWTLSRIGARALLYGPNDRVVPSKEVEKWINGLLEQKWKLIRPLGNALSQMARKTGDHVRDLEDELTTRIIDWLYMNETEPGEFTQQIKFLKEIITLEKQEKDNVFGEELPQGIILQAE